MTARSLAAAALLALVSATAAAQTPSAGSADSRMQRLERWLDTVLQHNPGQVDPLIVEIGKLSNVDLQTLDVDSGALVRIIRAPNLAASNSGLWLTARAERADRVPRPIRYTPKEVILMKQLACAIGGFAEAAPCAWARPALANDGVLNALVGAAASVRRDLNGNFLLHRAALMHTDVATFGLAAPQAVDLSPGGRSVRMSIADGHQTALTQPDVHWDFARRLLDQVAAAGTVKVGPASDDLVRRWYIATSAWMQQGGHFLDTHLDHGREIFPNDAELAMLAGALHESYASAGIQTAVRSAVLPTGIRLAVDSERNEIKDAEKFLRRALELNPDLAEAHIRLGHALSLLGRDTEAAEHLETGLRGTSEKLMRYYGSLFLAMVEERLGHLEAARSAYESAAALFPKAQSPLLGLSELARRTGRREEALQHMERVYGLAVDRLEDEPWWTYTYAQGRNADALLDEVQKPFRRIDRQ